MCLITDQNGSERNWADSSGSGSVTEHASGDGKTVQVAKVVDGNEQESNIEILTEPCS